MQHLALPLVDNEENKSQISKASKKSGKSSISSYLDVLYDEWMIKLKAEKVSLCVYNSVLDLWRRHWSPGS
jgi:hypothetical protein